MKLSSVGAGVLALMVISCSQPAVPVQTTGTAGPHAMATPVPTTGAHVAPPLAASPPPDQGGPVPTPDLRDFPTAPAPGNLAAVPLPNDFSEVTAVFEQLPPEITGHPRSPQLDRIAPERSLVGYGEDQRIPDVSSPRLAIQAIDLTKGDFFPTNWTGGQVVAEMARRGEEVPEYGRDGDLVWMRQETFMSTEGSSERFPVYAMAWGRINSPWMFSVQADTPEGRDALRTAFVMAAQSALH